MAQTLRSRNASIAARAQASIEGELLKQAEQLGASILGQPRVPECRGVQECLSSEAEPLQYAERDLVDGNRMTAKCLLDDRGRDVVGGERVVGVQDLQGFLERSLGERVEGETVRSIEELAEEAANFLSSFRRLGNSGEPLFDFFNPTDPDFVPVEEFVTEARKCLVGLLTRGILVTDSVDDRLEHGKPGGVAVGARLIAALERGMNVGEKLRFALCRHGPIRGLKNSGPPIRGDGLVDQAAELD